MKNICDLIIRRKLIAICRGIYGEDLKTLATTLQCGGISLIEVTFDHTDRNHLAKTTGAISMLAESFPEMAVGAGTVIRLEHLNAAAAAGATFIISPNTDPAIIAATKDKGLVSIPGAMTPSEIVLAQSACADFVKLFPCDQLGAAYVKAVLSPLNSVMLIATGGIRTGNLDTYLALGMAGAGMGGELCDRELIRAGRFDMIEEIARACVAIASRYHRFE